MHNSVLRLVAYYLKKMNPARYNYIIYDKELLVITRDFKMWRPELTSASANQPIKVFTDHKNLEHFMVTKQLYQQQAKWAKFPSEFNF